MNIPLPAFTDNYIWLLVDAPKKSAVCVDPGEAEPVISYLQKENLALDAILLTHHHHDHIGGVEALLTFSPQTQVYGPQDARIPFITQPVFENNSITLLDKTFKVLAIPGHTSSHIAYYETQLHWLFCGDTLFSAGCGRVFDGSYIDLYTSLNIIKALPEDTTIYCAHEYTLQNLAFAQTVEPHNKDIQDAILSLKNAPSKCSLPSSLSLEKRINPFLRLDSEEIKQYAKHKGASLDDFSVFKQLRDDKNNF